MPRGAALFAGRTGAVPLPDGRLLLVRAESAAVVDTAAEPADNALPAPEDSIPTRRPAVMDASPLFGAQPALPPRQFQDLWPLRDTPDDFLRRDPYTGGLVRVAQAFRAAAAVGVHPLALSYQLRFGEPQDAECAYQLKAAIQGMADAARMLDAPFLAGQLLFDTATGLNPAVRVLAWTPFLPGDHRSNGEHLPDVASCSLPPPPDGTAITLLGRMTSDLGGSLYAAEAPGFPPALDLVLERRVLEIVREAGGGVPLARGGLLLTLARCCGRFQRGARVSLPAAWHNLPPAAVLYGEAQSRFLLFLPPDRLATARLMAADLDVPLADLGVTGGHELDVQGVINLNVEDLR